MRVMSQSSEIAHFFERTLREPGTGGPNLLTGTLVNGYEYIFRKFSIHHAQLPKNQKQQISNPLGPRGSYVTN